MDESMLLYWKLFYEKFPNDLYLKNFTNLLKSYLPENSGAILDIGCGQSEYILDLIKDNYAFVAVDNEPSQLEYLHKRITNLGTEFLSKVTFISEPFPTGKIVNHRFDGIIISNFLHFFTIEQCHVLVTDIYALCKAGTVIVITVHNKNHSSNREGNPERYSQFKHYFSEEDIIDLFGEGEYEYLYKSNTSATLPYAHIQFVNEWLGQWYAQWNIMGKQLQALQTNYCRNSRIESMSVVLKKK
jgi:cyclopropane fatty-acyl-phospholipid synthase-like methyltransferase